MLTWKYINVLDIKEKLQTFLYYIHILEIPTNNG